MKPKITIRGYEIAGRMPLFQKWGRDAIREDRKTVTRRVIIPQPPEWVTRFGYTKGLYIRCFTPRGKYEDNFGEKFFKLPWRVGEYRVMTEPLKKVGSFTYYADTNEDAFDLEGESLFWRWNKNTLSAMFMLMEAARTVCQITGIRAERVQDITTADIAAEGICVFEVPDWWAGTNFDSMNQAKFRHIWDSINKKRGYGWDVNPWVWAVEFKKI